MTSCVRARKKGAGCRRSCSTSSRPSKAWSATIERLPARSPAAVKQRLKEQVGRLLEAGTSFDETRLYQEAVLLATRADTEEELKRLTAHIAAARQLLHIAGACGAAPGLPRAGVQSRGQHAVLQVQRRRYNASRTWSSRPSSTRCASRCRTLSRAERQRCCPHSPARPAAGAVLAVGRGQDHARAPPAGSRQRHPHVGIGDDAQGQARRGGRRRLHLRRQGGVRAAPAAAQAARVGGGVRPALRHAEGAGPRSPEVRATTCCSTSIGRAPDSSRSGFHATWSASSSCRPTRKTLERRLKGRNQDSETVVAQRMAAAAAEIEHWNEYDYVIVNADVEHSTAGLRSILAAERLKRERQSGLGAFVARMCWSAPLEDSPVGPPLRAYRPSRPKSLTVSTSPRRVGASPVAASNGLRIAQRAP